MAQEAASEQPQPPPQSPVEQPEYRSTGYVLMWYGTSGRSHWAPRKKSGDKKQVWAISGRRHGLSKHQTKICALEGVEQMDKGMAAEEAKQFALSRMAAHALRLGPEGVEVGVDVD